MAQREDADGNRRWSIDRLALGLWLLGLLAALAVLWGLGAASPVLIPLAGAFFVAVAVAPVGRWVRDRVPPRLALLGPLAAMLTVLLVLAVFAGGLWFIGQRVAGEVPRHADELQRLWGQANGWIEGLRERFLGDSGSDGGSDGGGGGAEALSGLVASVLTAAREAVSTLVIVLFLALLMLVEAPVWREKIVKTLGPERCATTVTAVTAIAQQFRRFLLVSTTLGLITGALYIGWLSLFGIDFLFLWGFLAFLLNYIPVIGSVGAATLPVLMALAQSGSSTALMVAGGLLVIEQVMGNFIGPRLEGKQLAISPLVIVSSLLLWSWLWGAAGTVLAVPMTVLIAIALSHIDALRPFAFVLSDKSDRRRFEARTRPE
ncbi:AI-2 transport protein TqsA [Azospirillum sp. OGB3]|uniref:AI-2E family transporter n=1 Tax=Azospirillum sp. OGB3 TaxID=2587012 RepID=UPI001605C4CA|nr:AI-2E family transporter [Azospirillum sp. OGB3]MBB3268794.1 AI-2 transport protein TqsA [Azospirillum sp. OGB3]